MKIKEVVAALERFAPLPLQESYDNAGLQIGLTEGEKVSGVLLCLDVTEEVVREAAARGCNLVVAHHPLLFRPLRHLWEATSVERSVSLALRLGVAVYAAHTNLDNAPGGVNFMMAERLGLRNVGFLQPFPDGKPGGSGAVGELPAPMSEAATLCLIAKTFGAPHLRYAPGPHAEISKIAFCGGAGDFLIDRAAELGAQLFFTGEVGYHRFFGYENRMCIAEIGHYESEQFTVQLLERILRDASAALRVEIYERGTNPVKTL